ncbi:MAG TPA: methyl-accepting chemotaxis protein [Solimonas sp.]|nr:methyl-accepting chemotaxis protein [Solimonas sp.]
MKHWTIRQRTIGSFAVVLLLMIAVGLLAFWDLSRIEREAEAIQSDSLPGLYYSTQLMTAWQENYALTEAHVLEEERAALERLEAQLRVDADRLRELDRQYEASITRDEDRQNFQAFQATQEGYRQAQQEVLKHGGVDGVDAAARTALHRLQAEFEKLGGAVRVIVEDNKAHAEESATQIRSDVVSSKVQIMGGIGLALVLAFVCGYFLLQAINRPLTQLLEVVNVMRTGDFSRRLQLERRDEFGLLAEGFNRMVDELTALVGQVQKSGIQVNTSVTEIAATAREQQATATEIAATTTEIGATSREITATSRELVKTMHEVATVAEQSATLAGSGQTGLSQMEETMHNVMEAAGTINAKLAILNEKAGNITQVVTTITKVADQTNLLSLNAAIEAEKAGEYGRGFSVVATEIRRLADQTAVATYDIEQMVKEIQSAVSAGVMGMDKFSEEVRRGMHEIQQVGGQLTQIIQQVQALAPRVESVNEGMQAQATGAEQITLALTQLTEAAQQTVESLRQSNIAIDGLNQVSSGLRSGVSRFKLEM